MNEVHNLLNQLLLTRHLIEGQIVHKSRHTRSDHNQSLGLLPILVRDHLPGMKAASASSTISPLWRRIHGVQRRIREAGELGGKLCTNASSYVIDGALNSCRCKALFSALANTIRTARSSAQELHARKNQPL